MNKRRLRSVWAVSPAASRFAKHLLPGTREFFDETMRVRNTYEVPWLFELVPFPQCRNRKVLELGNGAGYDAYEFCRHGADYTGVDIAIENAERTRKHLRFYGLTPKVVVGDVENLMLADESFHVVFSNGVLHHTSNIERSLREAYRVLKRGGEFWIIVYHRDSITFWIDLFLLDHLLRLGFLKRTFKKRLSMVEYTASGEFPIVNVYSRRALKRLLKKTGFTIESLWIRKLRKEDLPARFLRFIPQRWLDFVGEALGWYVIAKARKP